VLVFPTTTVEPVHPGVFAFAPFGGGDIAQAPSTSVNGATVNSQRINWVMASFPEEVRRIRSPTYDIWGAKEAQEELKAVRNILTFPDSQRKSAHDYQQTDQQGTNHDPATGPLRAGHRPG
jgi:hypothetical protein